MSKKIYYDIKLFKDTDGYYGYISLTLCPYGLDVNVGTYTCRLCKYADRKQSPRIELKKRYVLCRYEDKNKRK